MYHKSRHCPGQTHALHILNILLKQSTLHNTHPMQKSSPKEGIIPHLKKPSRERVCLRFWCTIAQLVSASRSGISLEEAYDTAMELRPLYDSLAT